MILENKLIEVETKEHVCGFHKNNPYMPHAGCTCSTAWIAREKPITDQYEDIKPHHYIPTNPYKGCRRCGYGLRALFHNLFEVEKYEGGL